MSTYVPLIFEHSVLITQTNMLALSYGISGYRGVLCQYALSACFSVKERDDAALEVSFDSVKMFRALDEIMIHTEENEEWEGIVPDHFAYEVTGSKLYQDQSIVFDHAFKGIRHYRFFTSEMCLDVISFNAPSARIIPFAYPASDELPA